MGRPTCSLRQPFCCSACGRSKGIAQLIILQSFNQRFQACRFSCAWPSRDDADRADKRCFDGVLLFTREVSSVKLKLSLPGFYLALKHLRYFFRNALFAVIKRCEVYHWADHISSTSHFKGVIKIKCVFPNCVSDNPTLCFQTCYTG